MELFGVSAVGVEPVMMARLGLQELMVRNARSKHTLVAKTVNIGRW